MRYSDASVAGRHERNRYEPVPLFIATDSVLHNYHLFFDHLLRVVETEKLAPELKELNKAMLTQSLKQYESVIGADWEQLNSQHCMIGW